MSDSRVIAAGWAPGVVGAYAVQAIALKDVTNVTHTAKALFSELRFQVAGGEVVIKRCPQEPAAWVAETVRDRLAQPLAEAAATTRADGIPSGVSSQIGPASPKESTGEPFLISVSGCTSANLNLAFEHNGVPVRGCARVVYTSGDLPSAERCGEPLFMELDLE